jgi:hypothetical protein
MPCQTCINDCCVRPCVEELLCAMDCCGCCHVPILLGPNLDIPAGTILGQRTTDLRFFPFQPLAVDGTQLPRGILQYHVQTNANGDVINRYFGHLGLGLDCGPKYTNMYVCGIFRIQDIFGDLASALSAGWARLIDGNPDGSGLFRV